MVEDYEHQSTRFITCPYCGYEFPDSWEFSDIKGSCDVECSDCEKTFILEQPDIEILYTTTRKIN